MKPEELLTPDEVCARLKVSKAWLYGQVQRKQIPYVKLGARQLRFKPADLQHWVDQQYVR